MTRAETLTPNSVENNADMPRVAKETRGTIDVLTIKGDGLVPPVEAHVPNSGRSGIRDVLNAEQGIYGLQYNRNQRLFREDTRANFTKRGIERAAQEVKAKVPKKDASPAIITASNGVVVHAPADSPLRVMKISEQNDTVIDLGLEGDDAVKKFIPDTNDVLVIVDLDNTARLIEDRDAAFAEMDQANTPYLKMTFEKQQALAMRAGRIQSRRQQRQEAASEADTPLEGTIVTPAPAGLYAGEKTIANTAFLSTAPNIIVTEEEMNRATTASTNTEPSASSQALARMSVAQNQVSAEPHLDANVSASPIAERNANTPVDKLTVLEERVVAAEALAAVVTAKRGNGKLFGRKQATESIEARNEQLDKLERWTALLDKEQVAQWRAEGLAEEEVVERLVAFQEARAVRRVSLNKEEMTKSPFAAFMDRYANLPRKQKILYGVGAAGVIGLAGATIGAGLGVFGGLTIAAAKVGKTYAQAKSKIYENTNEAPLDVEREYTVKTRTDAVKRAYTANELVGVAARAERDTRRQSFERSDKIKRNAALVAGIGAVALGAGAALTHFDTVRDWWKGTFDNSTPETTQEGHTQPGGEAGADTGAPKGEQQPLPVDPVPAPETSGFSLEASRVDAGEGWYQTFSEMGITSATEQANLLQKVGPELVARGWAYPMADGTFGISRPGALPKDVLELIQKSR